MRDPERTVIGVSIKSAYYQDRHRSAMVPKQYIPSPGTSVKLAFIKAGSLSPTHVSIQRDETYFTCGLMDNRFIGFGIWGVFHTRNL